MFELDKECKMCKGLGKIYKYIMRDDMVKCNNCDGVGYILTEVGKELLEFMQRWLKNEI